MNPSNDHPLIPEFNLPVCDIPERRHWEFRMSWEAVAAETESRRQYYMEHFDSPEKRLRNKNPEPFRMHSTDDSLLNPDKYGFDGPGGKPTNEEIDRIVYGA